MTQFARVLVLIAGIVALPGVAYAQCVNRPPFGDAQCSIDNDNATSLSNQLASLGVNAALGGLTAGLMQLWRGGEFSDGFALGALGGAVTWTGKRIVVEEFEGAGFLGRQVAAVGDAFVRNASEGVPLLDRFYLPIYLVSLEVRPRAPDRRLQPRLDVVSAGWTIYSVIEPELTFDAESSLSAGALVFQTNGKLMTHSVDGETANGRSVGSLVFLARYEAQTSEMREHTFAHERVHTLQFDQTLIQWSGPLEEWALTSIGLPGLARWLDFNVAAHVLGLMMPPVDYEDRPWEIEARWLAR